MKFACYATIYSSVCSKGAKRFSREIWPSLISSFCTSIFRLLELGKIFSHFRPKRNPKIKFLFSWFSYFCMFKKKRVGETLLFMQTGQFSLFCLEFKKMNWIFWPYQLHDFSGWSQKANWISALLFHQLFFHVPCKNCYYAKSGLLKRQNFQKVRKKGF